MKKYIVILIGFFSFFLSFNVFASSHKQNKCTDSLNSLKTYDDFNMGSRLPWRIPHGVYAEVMPSFQYINSWENHLECIKQEEETTEAEIQRIQEYVDYIRQDFNNYVEELYQIYPPVQKATYGGCSHFDRYHTFGVSTLCLLD